MSELENMTQYKEKATDFELLEKIASKMSDENYIKEAEQRYKERISEEFDKLITDTKDPEERIAREALRRSNSLNIPKEIRDVLIELITHSYNQYRAGQKNISVGLFDYPVLMAADILLYDADLVPVGEDQIQHVELTRDLAKRFNHNFGQTFKIPEAKTLKAGARIMGLDNPLKKMSKSGTSENDCLYLLDEPEKAYKKIMRATTDSGNEIKYDKENKPGVSNLLTIYSLLTDKDIKILEKEYKGKGYGDFKKDLAEIVKSFLTDFQKKWYKINNKIVLNILKDGSKKLQKQATAKLKITKEKIGII
jgi:tryptophanyl-tRNA synthetase